MHLQGLAGGLMLSISFFDLYPESVEAVGSGWASLWFFIGVAFFAAIVAFIPHPDSSDMVLHDPEDSDVPDPHAHGAHGHHSPDRQHAGSKAAANGSGTVRRRRK
jgi:zinc transporter, ZIP family